MRRMADTFSRKGLSKSRRLSPVDGHVTFGLIQYPITPNVDQTRHRVFDLLEKIRRQKPDYVVLPEMWLGGPKTRRDRGAWAALYRRAVAQLRDWCFRHRIGVFCSAVEQEKKKFFNTAFSIDQYGRIAGRQRKIHLFRLEGETKLYRRGGKTNLFRTPQGKIGCLVCYDIRFPEVARALAVRGMTILVVCAQWPSSRRDHWLTLLKARAIENQCFVVAVNRLGRKGRLTYGGDSVVFDPWGKELRHLSRRVTTGTVRLDLGFLKKVRKRYPFLAESKYK